MGSTVGLAFLFLFAEETLSYCEFSTVIWESLSSPSTQCRDIKLNIGCGAPLRFFFIFFISSYTCDQSFCLHPSTDRWEWKEAESCPEKQVEVNNFRNKWNVIYSEFRFICLFIQFCSAEMTDLCSWPMGFLFNTVYKKYMCMTQTHSICYNLWVLHLSDGKQCERITASAVKTEQNRKAVLSIRRIGK